MSGAYHWLNGMVLAHVGDKGASAEIRRNPVRNDQWSVLLDKISGPDRSRVHRIRIARRGGERHRNSGYGADVVDRPSCDTRRQDAGGIRVDRYAVIDGKR